MTKKQTKSDGTVLLRKISPKTVCGDVKKMAEGFLMRVTGIISDTQEGDGDKGPWVALLGKIIAQDRKGINYISGKCFLPEPGLSLVTGQLMGEDVSEVKFSFDLYKVIDDTSVTGYTYETRPVIEVKADNILQSFVDELPALPES